MVTSSLAAGLYFVTKRLAESVLPIGHACLSLSGTSRHPRCPLTSCKLPPNGCEMSDYNFTLLVAPGAACWAPGRVSGGAKDQILTLCIRSCTEINMFNNYVRVGLLVCVLLLAGGYKRQPPPRHRTALETNQRTVKLTLCGVRIARAPYITHLVSSAVHGHGYQTQRTCSPV